MNYSYFEIHGRLYVISIETPSERPSVLPGVPNIRIEESIRDKLPDLTQRSTKERPRRWDDTWEKREQAKRDYGWGPTPSWKFA